MQRMFLKVLAMALLMSSAAYGQSLGDIARENREKQSAEDASSSAAKPRVITNADLPKNTNPNQGPSEAQPEASAVASGKAADQRAAQRSDQRSAQQRLAEQRAAEQWKRQILAQKNRTASLQARIDQLNASIRSAYGTAQYEGPSSQSQARQLQQMAQIQQQLDEQKRKLADMQEAARRAGMHTAVYDP